MIDVTSATRRMLQRWTDSAGSALAAIRLRPAVLAAHLLVLLLGFAVTGCAALGDTRRVSWTEEVRLSTGEVIRIERWEQQELVAEPFQKPGWIFRRAGLKARLPVAGLGELTWEGTLTPLALDLGPDGAVYFVGVADTIRAQREYRAPPQEIHLAFRLGRAEWDQIKLHELPRDLRPNLLANTSRYIAEKRPLVEPLVTLQMKSSLDSVSGLWEAYKAIPRH